MERSSKRHPRDEGDDDWYENSKKPAKKSDCSVHDYKTNISGGVIKESSTLPLDAFMVVLEFLHPRVRDILLSIFCSYQLKNYFSLN